MRLFSSLWGEQKFKVNVRPRNPENAEGPFYVEANEGVGCGAPESEAEGLMSHREDGQCFFMRQPVTQDEVSAAIRAVRVSCCGAVRYGGDDTTVLVRLAAIGVADSCDVSVNGVPIDSSNLVFARIKLETEASLLETSPEKLILERISNTYASVYNGVEDLRFQKGFGTYRQVWARGITFVNSGNGHAIRITVEKLAGTAWLLAITENQAAALSMAIGVDTLLRKWPLVKELAWFPTSALALRDDAGRKHPY